MRNRFGREFKLFACMLWAAAILGASSALVGCSKAGGKAQPQSKSLVDLAEWFKSSGIDGSFSLQDPTRPIDLGGGKVIQPPPDPTLIGEGTFSDAVNNQIRHTFCTIRLFDSEESAKKAIRDPKEHFVNGPFLMSSERWRGKDNNLVFVFSQFKPYR